VADDLADFADRRGRTIEDELATYRPTAGGWIARVSRLTLPNRSS